MYITYMYKIYMYMTYMYLYMVYMYVIINILFSFFSVIIHLLSLSYVRGAGTSPAGLFFGRATFHWHDS